MRRPLVNKQVASLAITLVARLAHKGPAARMRQPVSHQLGWSLEVLAALLARVLHVGRQKGRQKVGWLTALRMHLHAHTQHTLLSSLETPPCQRILKGVHTRTYKVAHATPMHSRTQRISTQSVRMCVRVSLHVCACVCVCERDTTQSSERRGPENDDGLGIAQQEASPYPRAWRRAAAEEEERAWGGREDHKEVFTGSVEDEK